jgi:hypothetical protein
VVLTENLRENPRIAIEVSLAAENRGERGNTGAPGPAESYFEKSLALGGQVRFRICHRGSP